MMFATVSFSLLFALIPVVLSQNTGDGSLVQDLISYLNATGLTEAANVLNRVNNSSNRQWLSRLQNVNFTVFVPDNAAFQNLSSEIANNTDLVSDYLSYHFVFGDFRNRTASSSAVLNGSGGGTRGGSKVSTSVTSARTPKTTSKSTRSPRSSSPKSSPTMRSSLPVRHWWTRQNDNSTSGGSNATGPMLLSDVYPNTTIGRTLLNSSQFVQLEGNLSQVLAWTRLSADSNVTILNQFNVSDSGQNITVTNSSSYRNFFINTINGIIIPPGNLTTALNATNATAFLNLVQQVNISSSSDQNTTALNFLEQSARGITIFVPNNQAFQDADQLLSGLQNNQTALTALLQNHFINGTSIYSPDLRNLTASGSNPQFITAGGGTLSISSNTSGLFIQNQNGSSAQIVRPDVLIRNGVFHIIDRVLFQTDTNPQQASSAYASATSAASAFSSTATLPIGGGFGTLTRFTNSPSPTQTETSATTSATQQLHHHRRDLPSSPTPTFEPT